MDSSRETATISHENISRCRKIVSVILIENPQDS
jgi:hypothetical protein